ncbi:cell wall hydrolase [Methylocapsa acidiphila]|uniref:cell wall hydrolase n=1 Tax=Methylocapsa acidiphila TaxID=133552 RepID=UPI00040D2A7C|nr:cell wall hydrolase [Methylocapsa acidiphila]
MGRTRIEWAVSAVAPWWLGIALAASLPADAGQEASIGSSLAPLVFRTAAAPALLIPAQSGAPDDEYRRFGGEAGKIWRDARLALGDPDEFKRLPDEIEPRSDLKRRAGRFPTLDRSHKGDPFVGLRPTFDTQLRRPGGLAALRAHDLIFDHDETSPTGSFTVLDEAAGDPESAASFEPWPDGESPTTLHSGADSSPRQDGGTVTMRPAAINERILQGSTPPVRRAIALGSTTPAPADSTPVEVVAIAGAPRTPGTSAFSPAARPNFASLIEQDQSARERRCLAEAIYFEARSESEEGQAAVAQVVLNRVSSGLYPPTICGVVYQNRQHYNACQFSFACEGKSLRVTEPEAWRAAVRIADEVTAGKTYVSDVGGATHYHANYVRPRWAKRLEKMDVIGRHVFYKLRPGQT